MPAWNCLRHHRNGGQYHYWGDCPGTAAWRRYWLLCTGQYAGFSDWPFFRHHVVQQRQLFFKPLCLPVSCGGHISFVRRNPCTGTHLHICRKSRIETNPHRQFFIHTNPSYLIYIFAVRYRLFHCSQLYRCLHGYLGTSYSRQSFFLTYAVTSCFSRPLIGRFMDHHGGDVVMYPTLLIMALCMTTLGLASTNAVFAFGGILLGLSYSTISSAGQALAIHGIPEQQIGLATSTFFIFLDLGVGIGPYLLGFLVPAYGFSSVYFSAAFIAFVSLPLYYLLIGKSGVFSYKQMNAVRHQEQNKHTTWSIQK